MHQVHGFWPIFTGVIALALWLFDMQNCASRIKRWILPLTSAESWDFTIIIPVYGTPKYLADRSGFEPYKENVIVALDTGPKTMQRSGTAMFAFADQLRAEGWRVELVRLEDPGPPTIVREILDRGCVTTKYVVRMDCDTIIPNFNIQNAIAAADTADADVCSVKTYARDDDKRYYCDPQRGWKIRTGLNWCERFQALEYRMAMLARHYRPWMLSGACLLGKTNVIQRLLHEHSGSYFGEDSETGRIAHARRVKIRHLDFIVETEVPHTWRSLAKQRRIWWTGAFRHTFVNFDRSVLQHPAWSVYYVGLAYVALYSKWNSWFVMPGFVSMIKFLPLLLSVYAVMTLISNWQVRQPLMIVYPLYALVQTMFFPIIGALNFIVWVAKNHRLGRYRFPHRRKTWQPGVEIS